MSQLSFVTTAYEKHVVVWSFWCMGSKNYSKVSILRNASDEHSKEIKLHYDVVEILVTGWYYTELH